MLNAMISAVKVAFTKNWSPSDGSQEFHHGIAVLLGELVEPVARFESVALAAVAVPEYGFDLVARPAVVQPVLGTRVGKREAASPERSGTAP